MGCEVDLVTKQLWEMQPLLSVAPTTTESMEPVNTKWSIARIENEILDIERQLSAGRGLTHKDRRRLRLRKQARQWLLSFKKRLAAPPDVIGKKKERRLKATAKKLRWLARQDFDSMTPEARCAAEKLLRSDLAGQLLSVTPTVAE